MLRFGRRREEARRLSVAERDAEKVDRELLKYLAEDKIKGERWERDEREGKNEQKRKWHRVRVAGVFFAGLAGALLTLFDCRGMFGNFEDTIVVYTVVLCMFSSVPVNYPWRIAFKKRVSFMLECSLFLYHLFIAVSCTGIGHAIIVGIIVPPGSWLFPAFVYFSFCSMMMVILGPLLLYRREWDKTTNPQRACLTCLTLTLLNLVFLILVIPSQFCQVLKKGAKKWRNMISLVWASFLMFVPGLCYLILTLLKPILGEGPALAMVWQPIMVVLYILNKVVAAGATTTWLSAVLLFGIIIVADYFISFIFITAEFNDMWFWGALAFDYLVLVLRGR